MLAMDDGLRFDHRDAEAVVLGEGDAAFAFDARDGVAEIERGDQIRPLARGDDDDHRPFAVARHEVAAEEAIDRVAEPRAVLARIEDFGDAAEVGDGADRDVRQGEADLAAFAADAAPLDRGEQREGGIGTGEQVPGGQDMVDRLGPGAG